MKGGAEDTLRPRPPPPGPSPSPGAVWGTVSVTAGIGDANFMRQPHWLGEAQRAEKTRFPGVSVSCFWGVRRCVKTLPGQVGIVRPTERGREGVRSFCGS